MVAGWRGEVNVPNVTQVRPDLLVPVAVEPHGGGFHSVEYERATRASGRGESKLRPYRRMMAMGRPLPMLMVCDDPGAAEHFLSLAGDLPMLAAGMEMALQGRLTGADTVWRSPVGQTVELRSVAKPALSPRCSIEGPAGGDSVDRDQASDGGQPTRRSSSRLAFLVISWVCNRRSVYHFRLRKLATQLPSGVLKIALRPPREGGQIKSGPRVSSLASTHQPVEGVLPALGRQAPVTAGRRVFRVRPTRRCRDDEHDESEDNPALPAGAAAAGDAGRAGLPAALAGRCPGTGPRGRRNLAQGRRRRQRQVQRHVERQRQHAVVEPLRPGDRDPGRGEDQTTVEKFPHDYWVRIIREGLAMAHYVNPSDKGKGGWSVRFRHFEIGKDYAIMIQPRDADADPQGAPVSFAVKPRHVSPPEPPRNLAVTAADSGHGMTIRWDAPERGSGGKPKYYGVVVTNTETGRVRADRLPVSGRSWKPAKVSFDGLWPGETYQVGVQTYARNSRYDASVHNTSDKFQSSAFAVVEVTTPAGADPEGVTQPAPTLLLELVDAGDPAPPWVIGTSTAYAINAGDRYVRFDAPGRCTNWRNSHYFFQTRDAEAWKAIKEAQKQEGRLEPVQQALQKAQQELQKAKDDKAPPAVIFQKQLKVEEKQAAVDTVQRILDEKIAKVGTECARAYPVVENLTDADRRWYEASSRRDWEWAVRN